VFAVLSRQVERRSVASIQCYDLLGRLRWSREVCDAPEFDGSDVPRTRQHLLTLAGGQIVYANHAGAVVAVDAWTGQPTWAVRYPSRGADSADTRRDLAPAMHADGRVYVAPVDSERLLCIDALDGRVHWEAEPVEIVHLLGVAHGRVLTATRSGLQAFDAITGRTQWLQPSEARLPSLGRGLLAGNWLFWPTQDPLLPYRAVTVQEGYQEKVRPGASVLPEPDRYDPTLFTSMPAGNWAFGQGCLAIAGTRELVVYVPPRQPMRPLDPRLHARLGVSLVNGKKWE
jgi:hypothetical protein